MEKPNVRDFDLQPYGYIHALQSYVEYLENQNCAKKIETNEVPQNIYLNRLKEQYKETLRRVNHGSIINTLRVSNYTGMRNFCLDTELLDFNTIELMESEVSNEVNSLC